MSDPDFLKAGASGENYDINTIINKVNAETNRRYIGSSGKPGVISQKSRGQIVDDATIDSIINRINHLNTIHCYCQNHSMDLRTPGSSVSVNSVKSDFEEDLDYLDDVPRDGLLSDIQRLQNQCACNSFSDAICYCNSHFCQCQSHCRCVSHCDCDQDCICESQCVCQTNYCNCQTHCTCNKDCNEVFSCGCNNTDCGCDGECSGHSTGCGTDCNSQCTCNENCGQDCSTESGCVHCSGNCTCESNCKSVCSCDSYSTGSCSGDCTCDDYCNHKACDPQYFRFCTCDRDCSCNGNCSCDNDCVCESHCDCEGHTCGCNTHCSCDDNCTCDSQCACEFN